MSQMPNFSEYERISKIIFPIIITCSIIAMLISFALFIIRINA